MSLRPLRLKKEFNRKDAKDNFMPFTLPPQSGTQSFDGAAPLGGRALFGVQSGCPSG